MGYIGTKPSAVPLTSADITDGIITVADIASGTGGLVAWQSVQTTGFTAVKGRGYPCNTTSAAFTVTLPATPSAGDQIQLVDYAGTFDTNALTINPNGNKIESSTLNFQLTGEREGVVLIYIDSTQGWIATSGINEGTDALSPAPISIDFLVVAGGGGGSGRRGGGGGSGGFRTGTSTGLAVATNYTVTVGGGGTGGSGGSIGTSGSDSVFSTITSTGGGGARGDGQGAGLNGGSGGGGSSGAGGTGNTPNTSPSQGNDGGSGSGSGPNYGGGGGGGASAVGVNGTSTVAGNGGNGTASSITGSSVTYAGGGGGGTYQGGTAGSGGTGGGGNGGTAGTDTPGDAGTTNTGGGGGGGSIQSGNSNGGNGGSGIVILKYLDSFTISNPGGGLTFSTTTSAPNKITSFTAGTGNVQWN